MEKVSRYILVFIGVLTLAIVLPRLYWVVFEQPAPKPFILYSCIKKDFMIHRPDQKSWEDTKKTPYSRDEYEQALPMMFFKQILTTGKMPDTINGVGLDLPVISRSRSFFRLKADEVNAPVPSLFPLFESMSERVKFDWPENFFRITWRFELINASTNKIQEDKSQLFSAALYRKGFSFPAKIIAGLPTPRKSCDEGYLLVDAKDQLFHLKMEKNKPYVKRVNLPEGLKFSYISCVDFKNKDFYAYLFSDKNEIYILTQNDYQLIKWPVEGFELSKCDLKIYGDVFNYTVVIEGKNGVIAIALNSDYQLENSYAEQWLTREKSGEGKIAAVLFPAQVSMTSENSKFVRFYFTPSLGYNWLFLNFFLMLFQGTWLFVKKRPLKNHWPDLAVIGICGIFGFIGVNLFPNKFFS